MTQRAHIIVVGNAKGGSGKSTTTMHVATRLLALGYQVGLIDLDGRQQTLGRYIENREAYAAKRGVVLPMPAFAVMADDINSNHQDMYTTFCDMLEQQVVHNDVVLIDCPGSDTYLARLGHGVADTLLTPLNDSFIDIDLLARIDAETYQMISPSWYSEMIWELRKRRFLKDKQAIDWVVVRNRLSHTEARNKRHVHNVLEDIAPHIGFRQIKGLGERVIFRELFLKGLTLSDLRIPKIGVALTMNHIAAHQEVKDLVDGLKLPKQHKQSMQAAG